MKLNAFLIVIIVFCLTSCIRTQRDIKLEEELKSIRENQKILMDKQEKNIVVSRNSDYRKSQSIDDIRTELQLLKGKIEESEFRSQTKARELISEYSKDLLELKADIRDLKAELKTLKVAPKKVLNSKLGEKALYNKAYKLFASKKYKDSILHFDELLRRFPRTRYHENAQYFIADSFYHQNKCEDAILAYEEMLKRHSKSKRKAMVNLKQAECFEKIGAKDDAKYFYKQVIKKYPKSKEARSAKKKLKSLSGGKIKVKKK